MPVEVIMPKVDMDMDAGTLVCWHAAEGEAIERDAPLFDIETGKATMEVESPASGILHHVMAAEGETVAIGEPVAWIYSPGEAVRERPVRTSSTTAPSGNAGAPAPCAATSPIAQSRGERPRATPLARRRAREFGISLTGLVGSGPRGRIQHADVLSVTSHEGPGDAAWLAAALGLDLARVPCNSTAGTVSLGDVCTWVRQQLAQATSPRGCDVSRDERSHGDRDLRRSHEEAPDYSRFGEVERLPLSAERQQVAQARLAGWRSVPQVTHHDEADVSELDASTLLASVLAALARSMNSHPEVNASLSADGTALLLKRYCHIGVSMAGLHGLADAVVRDADQLSVGAIGAELGRLAALARDDTLSPGDREGSCIDVLWLGELGGTALTPLVRPPAVAALGVGRSLRRASWNGNHFTPRQVLPLSLSYDHRAIDGAQAARFMQCLRGALEAPEGLEVPVP